MLKIMLAMGLSKNNSLYQNWYLPLKELGNLHVFNTSKNSLIYGQEKMNSLFLKKVQKIKPDYLFLFLTYDELFIETLARIRKISPSTKIVNFFSDDDTQYEHFSRYLSLFCDYSILGLDDYLDEYNKEKLNTFFIPLVASTSNFKPLNLEKKYDVTFIGAMKENRRELISFLKSSGINIRVYGWNWDNDLNLKDIYFGIPNNEEMVKIINQSKINLSFTEGAGGILHIKGRVPEVLCCKSFMLSQYFKGYTKYFKENKEIVFFRDKKELLEKINYYLKNEKQREKIAENAYQKMITEYSMNISLKRFFDEAEKSKNNTPLPELKSKSITLVKNDFSDFSSLKDKIKNYDYISFLDKARHSRLKNYLQSYSLEKTKKPISCCSYYVSSKLIGKYLFWYFDNNKSLEKSEFNLLLDMNQLMIKKEFLLENFSMIKNAFLHGKIDFVSKDNTAFISLGLAELFYLKTKNYSILKKVFKLKFLHKLYSSMKKRLFSFYPLFLLFKIISGDYFILQGIKEAFKDNSRKEMARSLEAC